MNTLLDKLTKLEFYAVDLQLYIDTHPSDKQAIKDYNETVRKISEAGAEYEKNYGPLFGFVSLIDDSESNWIDEPWPWEIQFYTEGK